LIVLAAIMFYFPHVGYLLISTIISYNLSKTIYYLWLNDQHYTF